ncbi:MAG: extracellular solute-binding protein [Oscillospiraceae bacterium]
MKKVLAIVLVLALAFTLVACGGEKKPEVEKKLIVYSSSVEEFHETIGPAFQEATGIEIEFVSAATGEGYARMVAEKDNPQADILLIGAMEVYKDTQYYEPYVSPNNDQLPEAFRTKDGFVNATNTSTPVILYNTDLVNFEITGYEDLLKPELMGKIACGDSMKSASAYNHLENILLAMGKGDAYNPAAWDYVKALLKQLGGVIVNSSSAIHKGVVSGEYAVGLTWDTPCGTYIADGIKNVKVCLMKEGIVPKIAGTAIIKNCPHPENAKKFVDFMTSKEGQALLATIPGYSPVRDDIEMPSTHVDLGINKGNIIKLDYAWSSANTDKIKDQYQKLYLEIFE